MTIDLRFHPTRGDILQAQRYIPLLNEVPLDDCAYASEEEGRVIVEKHDENGQAVVDYANGGIMYEERQGKVEIRIR